MKLKKVHHIAWLLNLLAATVLIGAFFIDPMTELMLCGIAALFGLLFMSGYIYALRFYRCPKCDQLLPLGVRIPRTCRHCSADLSDAIE